MTSFKFERIHYFKTNLKIERLFDILLTSGVSISLVHQIAIELC